MKCSSLAVTCERLVVFGIEVSRFLIPQSEVISFFFNLMIVLLFSIRFPQNLVNFLTLDAKPFGKMISEYTNLLLLFADIRGQKLERWTDCVYGYKNGSCGFSGRMRLTSKLLPGLHYLILYWYRALIFFESRSISDLWRRRQKLILWYFGMLSIDIHFKKKKN